MSAPDRSACPVLILAPRGRDAPVAAALLREAGIASFVCTRLADLSAMLGEEVCCAVVTEEALVDADLTPIAAWVAAQASWSDFPFIVLTRGQGSPDRDPAALRLSDTLGNVIFLERPFHPMTFISVVGNAQRGRFRQFEARSRIEELHEGEARLQTALTAGQLGTWELDLSTSYLNMSATSRAVFGRTATEPFAYGDFEAGIHPDDRHDVREAISLSADTGRDLAVECRTVWPDGTAHWADLRARFVRDRGRRPRRMVGVCADITARKTAEENLRRLNETLEAKVVERTTQLERAHQAVLEEIRQRERMEEQLRQVQKMEMIGQLTGGVAHDFNNLLMAVIGNLELLRKQVPGEEKTVRLVDGALRGAQRGAALTQRLLAFARQQDLRIEPTDLCSLVRGMTDLIERSIGAEVELRLELPDHLPRTLADANQIELALLNLVVNARDAMPDGGTISIQVDVVHTSELVDLAAGDYVRVTVSDTGQGMDAVTLSKAAEPFFTTKEVGKGTGLGLSMIHGLALQLSGALRLASEPGRGTQAELWLPVTHAPAAPQGAEPASEGSASAAARATILVVDDDALIATSTAYLLEDLGHDVIEANSGAKALEILREGHKVDLLITDYSMPKMTGVQLADAARELRPGLPILLATGYADLPKGTSVDIPRLRKPYLQHQLVAEIAKALRSM
ncbi:response regulator [Paraburkholderia sp. LEh10]|uniref:hybrid sensor histidine kinase/response regulator n=1 Tax=Paraburkholderia sp. LEh10 TaxID=2821353 RepID=UPI001AE31ACD|nr:hybrid sensor histidine kinase/response regulator [Paraburkholderia sp. LEh10]MBP0590324.1 response regulator [Paraburkholderia sp. LEh10]